MSLPPTAVRDNVYVCFHDCDPTMMVPSFYLHDFGDIPQSNFKPIAEHASLSPNPGHHYAIIHTHHKYTTLEQTIDLHGKKSLFDLIARVNWDISYLKSVLRSFSHLNLQDLNGDDAKKVRIITKEIAEDKALLLFLEERFKKII